MWRLWTEVRFVQADGVMFGSVKFSLSSPVFDALKPRCRPTHPTAPTLDCRGTQAEHTGEVFAELYDSKLSRLYVCLGVDPHATQPRPKKL
ncbi:hypothetical protein ACOMHN_054023 [Nucella lapillus]